MTPQAGDYFVVSTQGVAARLIQWFTGSWANHCGIHLGGGWIIEANPGGVRLAPIEKYAGEHIAWSTLRLAPDEVARLVGACTAMEGIPYSWLDIAALAVHRLGWTFADARLNRGDRLICSQFVARAYRAAGHVLVPGKADNYVTPGDLAALLTEGVKAP